MVDISDFCSGRLLYCSSDIYSCQRKAGNKKWHFRLLKGYLVGFQMTCWTPKLVAKWLGKLLKYERSQTPSHFPSPINLIALENTMTFHRWPKQVVLACFVINAIKAADGQTALTLPMVDGKMIIRLLQLGGSYCTMCDLSQEECHDHNNIGRGLKITRSVQGFWDLSLSLHDPETDLIHRAPGNYSRRQGITTTHYSRCYQGPSNLSQQDTNIQLDFQSTHGQGNFAQEMAFIKQSSLPHWCWDEDGEGGERGWGYQSRQL